MTLALTLLLAVTAAAPNEEFEDWAGKPLEKFENGEKVFQAVKHELMTNYVKELTEEQLYRAAVQGMLSTIDPSYRDANKLMTPAQFAELTVEMKGELMGIGVQFKFDSATGRAEVNRVMTGSPAQKAGLRTGDVILTVDGASFKGKSIRDLVQVIRGKAGTKLTLAILRDAAIVTSTLERQKIAFDSVAQELLPGNIGLITLRGFNETTPAGLREALTALKGAKGLIIDLRDNEGGTLESAISSAQLLLPKGSVITKLVYRQGREDVRTNGEAPLTTAPMVVLINGNTRSSAELTAAALREGVHAPLIGTKTFGKWSVQVIKELPNHFVMRYTVAAFTSPDGKTYEGQGLPPDIEVERDEAALAYGKKATEQNDHQLRAALHLLRLQNK